MVKIILIKSPDEWATTKQTCRDELVVYLSFSSQKIYIYIYILYVYIHICIHMCICTYNFYKLPLLSKCLYQTYYQAIAFTFSSCEVFFPLL